MGDYIVGGLGGKEWKEGQGGRRFLVGKRRCR